MITRTVTKSVMSLFFVIIQQPVVLPAGNMSALRQMV